MLVCFLRTLAMNVAKFPKAGDRVKLIKVCYLLILKVHHHSFF